MRKLITGGALAVAAVVGIAGPAYAHSCANASRPGPTSEHTGGLGKWFYLEEVGFWVTGTHDGGSLLESSRHCTDPKETDKKNYNVAGFDNLHGIVTGCVTAE